ncbi:M50 family metallopeptidase [Petrocella sp. FN5]|uniref:M50 family metallopeptidase n=1 Tax=Petrocella sp. FN5 TaxID=3032002 RepID=UPI0023DA9A1D|nr:M50 family metallopeptidase [Petrocella sp. FN5]MDF1616788.1 M50 family metallopeptidase [Petrocella sp. FN5]
MSILVSILIFGLIILIHELGHFLFARKAGILVEEFAIGMGPKIVGKKVGDTLYSIRAIPFGGFCRMLGEDQEVENDPRAYSSKSTWARFQVIFAGPLFNFLLAFFFAIVYISLVGGTTSTISEVVEGYPAYESGVQVGDRIVGYNDRTVLTSKELRIYLNTEKPSQMELTVKRDSEKISYIIEPNVGEDGIYRLGVNFTFIDIKNPIEILKNAAIEIVFWIKIVIYSLGQLITGGISGNDIAGPVGIVGEISSGYQESIQYGIKSVIATVAFYIVLLSANLGVMNLLPIPALDGGRIVFIAIEALRGKPVDPNKEGFIHFVGYVLLMILMVLILFNDIVKAAFS